ncbi:unnamed protein product [Ectocarpus sp. CCAP 1310/34]|nr:unnamed protein product [Ectocarpus sp. CCAP 1310/34]
MASHHIKAAQWAKSKGTPRVVVDFCAAHGMWATDRQVRHREDFNAKVVEDGDKLPKDATCGAFPFDNCDMKPVVGVSQGEPHLSTIAASVVTVGGSVGKLEDASRLKRYSLLTLDDVMKGPNAQGGERRFEAFQSQLRRAVYESASLGSTPDGPLWCVEAQLRKDLTPEERATLDGRYVFIQLESTKKFTDNKAAIDCILRIWRGTVAGKDGAPCIIAGDEETYRVLYHIQKQERVAYRQFRRYPGDWHLHLHVAKALLKRYWGAGVEFVAKDLGTDNSKSSEGSNYRRAHHHLVVMASTRGDMTAEDADSMVVAWIKKRAAKHKTFALWEQFLLHDFPAYVTFRTALRTGDFMLRLDALRRIAPIFYITGKDRYQFLVVDHLAEMSTMSESDLKVIAELFSVSLSKDACARLGLDERQEVANRMYKTLTKWILPSFIHKLAPTAVLREIVEFEFEREFLEGPRRGLGREGVSRGKVARDSRCPGNGVREDSGVLFSVKKDKTKKRTTKKKLFSIPAFNTENKSTRSKGRSSKLKDTVGNACAGGQEMKAVVLNIWDMVEGGGSLSEEQVVGMVTRVGASTPFSMANATGGAKHANKSAGPTKWLQITAPTPSPTSRFTPCMPTEWICLGQYSKG